MRNISAYIFIVFLFIPPGIQAQQSSPLSNPNISVIGDFRGGYINTGLHNIDAGIHETEFAFQSAVDPYAKADFFLSLSRNSAGEWNAEMEEAYLTSLKLPARLQLKAGKFKNAFGRLNTVHPHALPFIDMPNAFVNFFGEEGLNDEGFSLDWLVPNPLHYFQQLTLETTSGHLDNPSFMQSGRNNFLYLAHLKNFWDLSRNVTLELGLSGVYGPNDSSLATSIGAADLTYKWKPLQFNTYRSFTWQTEGFCSRAQSAPGASVRALGLYSFITYQVSKRWFLTGRYDFSNIPYSDTFSEQAFSATAGWYATEFQKIELEGKYTADNAQNIFYQGFLRWIFVIGSHGAHQY